VTPVTVIDLDVGRPAAEPSARPPIRSLRPFGLALTVVLVFALGGAAPIAATLWRGAGHIPPPNAARAPASSPAAPAPASSSSPTR